MKKRVFLFIAVIMLVLVSVGVVNAACDGVCNGVCSLKGLPFYSSHCSSAEDPDCPLTAGITASCCGNNRCDPDETYSDCPEDCLGVRRNVALTIYGAEATSSTEFPGYPDNYANDGNPYSYWSVWRVDYEKWLRITFDGLRWVDSVYITTRRDKVCNIYKWNLTFSDGTFIEGENFYALINLTFSPRKIEWVQLNIIEHDLAVTPGVSEFEIYEIADFDKHGEACDEIYYWLPNAPDDPTGEKNYCCGDDADDFGAIGPVDEDPGYRYVCFYDETPSIPVWVWEDSWDQRSKILNIKDKHDVASDGAKWNRCLSPYANVLYTNFVRFGQTLAPAGAEGSDVLCYNEGGKGYFAECCLSDDECEATKSEPKFYSKERKPGEPANLLDRDTTLEYERASLSIVGNIVDFGGMRKDAPYKGIVIKDTLAGINEWGSYGGALRYDTLEFFVKMDILIEDTEVILGWLDSSSYSDISNYDVFFRELLKNYTVNRFEADEWAHVVIPLEDVNDSSKLRNVTHILFFVNVSAIPHDGELTMDIDRVFFGIERTDFNQGMFYCSQPDSATDAFWKSDLDDINEETCNSWPSYNWTGTQCCGDDAGTADDNYIDTEGACWQGNPAFNNTRVTENAVFYGNEFYICGIDAGIYEQADACDVVGSFSCLYSDVWVEGSRNMTRNAPNGTTVPVLQECCAYDECWNGTDCVDTTNIPYAVGDLNFTCYNGNWYPAEIKYDWNNEFPGFCSQPSDCLVHRGGDSSHNYMPEMYGGYDYYDWPVCIADGQFIEDHYCRNGSWTTRTRLIALQLLGLRGTGDFALYCDHYTDSLADYQYKDVEDYLGGDAVGAMGLGGRTCTDISGYDLPCVNHFCVIKYDDKILFGTSLNKDINDTDKSILKKVTGDIDYCNSLSGARDYKKCSGDDSVWYNPLTNSIIYSKSGEELYGPGVFGIIRNFFSRIFSFITDWQPKDILNQTINLTGIEINENYDRLYVQRFGDKVVYGTLTDINPERTVMVLRYENFTLPVCESVERAEVVGLVCNETAGMATIVGDTSVALGYWQDMTSSLRLK